jgi:hypothetical protein
MNGRAWMKKKEGEKKAENNIGTTAGGAAVEVAMKGDFEIFEKCSQFRTACLSCAPPVCVCSSFLL